jgi:predicted TIM-barrel fold metal-dependent hydrolase
MSQQIAVEEEIETTVVDVDAHYSGEFEDLIEYIDEGPWQDRFASTGASSSLKGFWPKITSAHDTYRAPDSWTHADDKADIMDVMDDLQIDNIIFLGNQMISFDQMKGDDRRPEIYANAYIDYLLDRLIDPEEGIYGMIPLPTNDPEVAAALIDRVADEEGIVAGVFIASKVEPPLGNRKYDPIYEAAEQADLPIVIHGGTPGVDNFYLSGYEYRLETHTLSFVWANTSQIVSIVAQGVPEKFPDLDFVFQECGIFWVPMMMYRMDAEYFRKPNEAPLLEKRPSKYMKEFYYGTQPLEHPPNKEFFRYVIEMLGGADRLMYASDYPHVDYDAPTAITSIPGLSDEQKEKILGGNAMEVFNL